MSQVDEAPSPPPGRRAWAVLKIVFAGVVAGLLWMGGQRAWREYQDDQQQQRESEDSMPIGYVGLNYRKSYHYRPAQFLHEQEGRKRLWAAVGEENQPVFYDVTDATFRPESLSGGYGRDSIPGVDHPLLEPRDSERGGRLRGRQVLYGLALGDGPRAYPVDLLKKIEVVNDRDGTDPFVVVFDRGRDVAQAFGRRIQGREVTFGTTGYTLPTSPDGSSGKPLLYDRGTKSLWLPEDQALVCVSGASKGTSLPPWRPLEKTTWSEWVARHPKTLVLFGNDRSQPIPSE